MDSARRYVPCKRGYGQVHDVVTMPNNTAWKAKYLWKALGFVNRELLQQFLMTRSDPVRRCQLEWCFNLTAEDVDELCEVVGDVVCWDGVELELLKFGEF